MKRLALVFTILAFVVVLSLFSGTAPRILVYLMFGWITYLFQVLPKVEIRWDGVGLFLAGLLLLAALFQSVASWLRRESPTQESRWKWKSSAMVLGIVMMMFVAGIAMVGITHQTYWLLSDDGDFMVPTLIGDETTSKDNLSDMRNAMQYSQEIRDMRGDKTESQHSWITYSLPYANYMTDINFQLPWDHPENRTETQKVVPSLLNPGILPITLRDEKGYGVSHYAGNSNVFDENDRIDQAAFDDGKSKTLLIGEVNASFQPWAKPDSNRDPTLGINRSAKGFGGPASNGGAYFSLADGSVKFFSSDTDPEVLKALSTPSGAKE